MPESKRPNPSRQPLPPVAAPTDRLAAAAEVTAALGDIPFQDSAAATRGLTRVEQAISPLLARAIPGLLADSPDPDSALICLERLVSESSGEVVRLLDRHHFLAHYAIVVFGHSRFLGETLIQNPDLLQNFLREKNLDRSFSREEFHESLARFRSRSFETDVSLLLARFKRREYVRIMLRDVLKLAPLSETTAEISALADVLIEEGLRASESWMQRRYGTAQHMDADGRLVNTPFAALSLGKLGGNELNYSSDVDLLYIFGDGQPAPEAPISNREYFIRLAQKLTETLSRVTQEGPVFRIDMRLRPQGGEGELAISLSHALLYYAGPAHDWERQALIKVRYSAGNEALGRAFIRGVQAQVYTEQVNFEAIETSLASRAKMRGRRRVGLGEAEPPMDVKMDRGGIRDIEFLVQCLQRVYGGAEPWLRSGGTLFSLHKLHDKQHISGKEFHELTTAYEFLRHLEHRLQLRYGRQTHRLPVAEADLQILQRSLEGYVSGEDGLGDVRVAVQRRMAAVAAIYNRIIHHQQARKGRDLPAAVFELRSMAEPAVPDQTQQQVLERLGEDSPAIYEIACRRDLGSQARRNLFRFLASAFTSSVRYAAVLTCLPAVEKALRLFATSDYLTEILIRHPEEITTLAELGEGSPQPGSGHLFQNSLARGRAAADPVFHFVAASSSAYAEKLSVLRRHFRHRMFAMGARDITELRDVYESLGAASAVAEDAVQAAFGIAGAPAGLAVMALGRLGTGEFDVLSDADVVFISGEDQDQSALTKAAEQIMQILAAYTRDGMVFPVDARLRPRGGEGELLITPTQLASYFRQEAQPWEALIYTKMRFLTGSEVVAERALAATRHLFERFAGDERFLPAVRDMRAKLEHAEAGERNIKTSPGAAYDIDFLTGYLLVKRGIHEKSGTLRERLWRCSAEGALAKADAALLDHAAELFRTAEHVVRLVTGRAQKWLPATEHARQVTEELTGGILGTHWREGLEGELTCVCREVRAIYERVLA